MATDQKTPSSRHINQVFEQVIQLSWPLPSLLFILCINDLPLAVGLSSVMLYADDTVIFSAASSIDQLQLNLSLDLNVVSNWLTANGLFLNLKKTE